MFLTLLPSVEISFPGMCSHASFVRHWRILTVESLTFEPAKLNLFKSGWAKHLKTGPVNKFRFPNRVTSTLFTLAGKDWAIARFDVMFKATILVHLFVEWKKLNFWEHFDQDFVRYKHECNHSENWQTFKIMGLFTCSRRSFIHPVYIFFQLQWMLLLV